MQRQPAAELPPGSPHARRLPFGTPAAPRSYPHEQVNAWLAEWLELWDAVPHCSLWHSHWMYLVARLAKDDKAGVVAWEQHLPRLYTKILWCFEVGGRERRRGWGRHGVLLCARRLRRC
jgi:hypothetical protein